MKHKLSWIVYCVFVVWTAALFLLALGGIVFGQDCANGQCLRLKPPAVADKVERVDNSYFAWEKINDQQFILRRNGSIVGQWFVPEHTYYPWDGKNNLPAIKPPIDPPGTPVATEHWQTHGCVKHTDRDQLSYGGRVIPGHRLHDAFEGKLEDDSTKGHFVIIAKDQAVRDRVFADWQKLPTEFTSRYNVWMAPPEHFSMQDRFNNKPRFFTEGDPTVVLQNKDGVVLFRRPQAEQKYQASDMQDLLKSDPNYNPKLDPGAPPTLAPQSVSVSSQTLAALGVAGAGAVLLFFRRKK